MQIEVKKKETVLVACSPEKMEAFRQMTREFSGCGRSLNTTGPLSSYNWSVYHSSCVHVGLLYISEEAKIS